MIIWQRFQKLCSVFPPRRFNFLGCFSYVCVRVHVSDCLPLSPQMSSYKRATLEEEEVSDVPAEAASSPDRVEVSEIHFICKAQIAASGASRRGRDLSALQRAALSDSGNHFKPFNWSQVKSQTQWHQPPACRPLRGQTENPTGAPQCESTTNKERSSRRSGAPPPRLLGNILAARGGQSVQTQTSGPTSATS